MVKKTSTEISILSSQSDGEMREKHRKIRKQAKKPENSEANSSEDLNLSGLESFLAEDNDPNVDDFIEQYTSTEEEIGGSDSQEEVISIPKLPIRNEGILGYRCKICDMDLLSLKKYKIHKSIKKSKCKKCKEIFLCQQEMSVHEVECVKIKRKKGKTSGKKTYPRYLRGIEHYIRRLETIWDEHHKPTEPARYESNNIRKTYRFTDY